MRFHKILLTAFLLLSLNCAFAQQQAAVPQVQTNDLQILTTTLSPVTAVSTQIVGQPGAATYYYWVVASYSNGKASPSPYAIVVNAPNTLNGSNYIQIFWQPVSGASSYDLLRTTVPQLPSGPANIAVSTGITASSYSDQGAGLSSYTVQTPPASQVSIELKPQTIFLNGSAGANGNCITSTGTLTQWGGCGSGNLPAISGATTNLALSNNGTSALWTVLGVTGGGTGLGSLGTAGQCLQVNSGATGLQYGSCNGGGSGTVTSVGLSLPSSLFSVSGSPVTTNGTLTGTLTTQSANMVFAGPSSGSAAPTFRSLVAADIPALNYQAPLSSYSAPTNEFLTGFTSPNTFVATQPSFSNLSGNPTANQLASGPVDGDCLGYNGTSLVWQSCGAGGSVTWNAIENATGAQALTQGYNSTWTCTISTADCFDINNDGTTGSNSYYELNLDTSSSPLSVTNPLRVGVQGVDQLKVMEFPGDEGGIIFGSAISNPWETAPDDVAKFIFGNSSPTFSDNRVINTGASFSADLLQLRTVEAASSTFNLITSANSCSATTGSSCTSGPFSVRGDGLTTGSVLNATTGFQIAGAAPSGHCLVGNGTDYVDSSSCGGGSNITLQTNGTNNASQTTLNLVSGSNITLTNTSGGNVTIAASGGGTGLPSYWVNNSTTGALQILPNGDDATPLAVGPASGVVNPASDVFDVYTSYLSTPSSFTGPTVATGGSIPVGDVVTACVTYVSPAGETPCSPSQTSAAMTSGSQSVTWSVPYVTGATAAKIYGAQCASPGPCTGLTFQAQTTSFNTNPIFPTLTSITTGGATSPSSNTALAGEAFGVTANGTINMPLTYNWTLGVNNQPSASFVRLYGGVGVAAYDQYYSPALTSPAAPNYGLFTTGGSIGTSPSSITVAYTYVNGPSSNFPNGQGNYPETVPGPGTVISLTSCTAGTCSIQLTPPTQGYAGAFNIYLYNGTNWILQNSSPITNFSSNVTLTSIPTTPVNAGPTTNTTGGQFMSTLMAAPGVNGLLCVESTTPSSDCSAGTFLATNPMTEVGDVTVGGSVDAEGVATPSVVHAGTSGQVLTSGGANTTPTWGSNSVTVGGQTCALGSSCFPADTTVTTSTSLIAANICVAQTAVTMTGLTTSMTLQFTATSDTSTVTGWGSPSSGLLYITDYPTANTINWKVCNPTSSSITPSASVTWNVSAR